jgi:hypothetical protein
MLPVFRILLEAVMGQREGPEKSTIGRRRKGPWLADKWRGPLKEVRGSQGAPEKVSGARAIKVACGEEGEAAAK